MRPGLVLVLLTLLRILFLIVNRGDFPSMPVGAAAAGMAHDDLGHEDVERCTPVNLPSPR